MPRLWRVTLGSVSGAVLVVTVVVVGTAAWVWLDAPKVGLGRSWALTTLALWIVFFPWYLVERNRSLRVRHGQDPSRSAWKPGEWRPDPHDQTVDRWFQDGTWSRHTRPRV